MVPLPNFGAFGVQVDPGFLERRSELEETTDLKSFFQVPYFTQSIFELLDFYHFFNPDWSQIFLTQNIDENFLFYFQR